MVKIFSQACQAKDPATCPYHGTEDTRKHRFLAMNPNTPAVMLEKLAKDKNSNVRRIVAANPNTPVIVLTELAKDEAAGVRQRVARNLNISAIVLIKLAKDEDQQVVELAITNLSNLSKEELLTLFSDKERESLNDLPKAWVLKLLLL